MNLRDLRDIFKEWVVPAVKRVPGQRVRPLIHEVVVILRRRFNHALHDKGSRELWLEVRTFCSILERRAYYRTSSSSLICAVGCSVDLFNRQPSSLFPSRTITGTCAGSSPSPNSDLATSSHGVSSLSTSITLFKGDNS